MPVRQRSALTPQHSAWFSRAVLKTLDSTPCACGSMGIAQAGWITCITTLRGARHGFAPRLMVCASTRGTRDLFEPRSRSITDRGGWTLLC
jgi:hypothetical protein